MNKLFVIIIILLYQFPGTVFGLEDCPGSQNNLQNWTNCIGTVTSDGELGFVYVGEWKDGRFHGQGTFTTEYDGGKYVGGFKNGNFHGQAISTLFGEKYVGEYKDNQKHGQGTHTMANGNQYEGEFKDDKRDGKGTYTWANGLQYVGEWKDDKRDGKATVTRANREIYVGEYKDDKQNGQGTYTWDNGTQYEGEFKDDKPHGHGTITTSNGTKQTVVFKEGVAQEVTTTSSVDNPNLGLECVPTLSKGEVQNYMNLGRLTKYGALDETLNGTPFSWRSTPDYYFVAMNEEKIEHFNTDDYKIYTFDLQINAQQIKWQERYSNYRNMRFWFSKMELSRSSLIMDTEYNGPYQCELLTEDEFYDKTRNLIKKEEEIASKKNKF